jgi:cytochrome c-type biogenesis protein CcmH/NrfG
MTQTHQAISTEQWTSTQAYTVAVICLLVGIAGGWLIHGSQPPVVTGPTEAASGASPAEMGASPVSQMPPAARLKEMADVQAAPLLERLKSEPNNAELLANIGNLYYDAQQYPAAIEYYESALKAQPANADLRTDMATAYWYSGNPDTAIAEFKKALSYQPNKGNTLFNLGIVQWQGKTDAASALATWQKLLDTNPNYEGKEKVLELMAQAKQHSGIKPGTPARPLPQ